MKMEKQKLKYWMIISKTKPLLINGQLPIFWMKRVAQRESKKLKGSIVVGVELLYTLQAHE